MTTICGLDHEHTHGATYKCYTDGGCRCPDCKKRNADYARNRNKQIVYGRWDTGMVDAAPVREHIRMLQAHGYGVARIVQLAGVPSAAVNRCAFPLHGKVSKTIKRSTAERILALQPDPELWADGAKVSPVGTRRRIQALVCMGWSMTELARRLGVEKWNFWKMIRSERVLASTHRAVAALYDELWNQTPPQNDRFQKYSVTSAKKYAAEHGWVSPLGWDDLDNDPEPADTIAAEIDFDPIAVDLACDGQEVELNIEERKEVIRRLNGRRYPDKRIAKHVGMNVSATQQMRKRLNLPGWAYHERATEYGAEHRETA